jgi:hypothetical protein
MATIRPILKEIYEYMSENKKEVDSIIRGLIVTTRVFDEDNNLESNRFLNTRQFCGPIPGEKSELERMTEEGDKQGIVMFNLEKRGLITAFYDDEAGVDTYTMKQNLALALVPSQIDNSEKSDYKLNPIKHYKEQNPIYEKLLQNIDTRNFNENNGLTQIDEIITTRYGIKLASRGEEIDTDELKVQKVKIENIEMKDGIAYLKTNRFSTGLDQSYIDNRNIREGDEVIAVSTNFNYRSMIQEINKI